MVTGAAGQLGIALREYLPQENSLFVDKENFDIRDKKETIKQITCVRPNVVIHTAAYTDVDGCEQNPRMAEEINISGTENIGLACQKIGATLVYLSTDYVFDGTKGSPYCEKDKPNPLSVYGKTKLEGELITKRLSGKYIIVRTSWLFGEGENFIKKILRLAQRRERLDIVNDQIGSPTYARDLAEAIIKLIDSDISGLFHITNRGSCSWYDFARQILTELKRNDVIVNPITSETWQKIRPNSAKRPKYSVLSNQKIEAMGIKMRRWQEALRDYLKIYGN